MKSPFILALILIFLGSVAGGIFILNKEKSVVIDNSINMTPVISSSTPDIASASASEVDLKAQEFLTQAHTLVEKTQEFIEQEKQKLALIEEVRQKSSGIKGIYIGASRNQDYFNELLDETELNSLVIDVKEYNGVNIPLSLKKFVKSFHDKDVWIIGRAVLFRDASLIEQNPNWYLKNATSATSAGTTSDLWRDKSGQYWLDPGNEEVQDYIIEFSKKVIDFDFDELQFDYIRYPDDYGDISGEEKVKIIGSFFAKLSEAMRNYKPSVILSVDLFGYVATQYNSYGTGQILWDAGKYFDYLSFMLYPSHFYGGFSSKGISYFYPDVVEHPYEVVYYSVSSARDYLLRFGLETKIRPWLQDFDLALDSNRGVSYDAEKIHLQIEAAQNATSSGWLLWDPSYRYTKEALTPFYQLATSTSP